VLKSKDVRHVSKLKRNLIFVGQLADAEMKINFYSDLCKTKKGAMIMAHYKKEGTFYMTSSSKVSILVASSDMDAGTWYHQIRHMNEKEKAMPSKGKLPGLKSINLNFYEECVYEKKRKISFSKVKKSLKVEKLELVNIDI